MLFCVCCIWHLLLWFCLTKCLHLWHILIRCVFSMCWINCSAGPMLFWQIAHVSMVQSLYYHGVKISSKQFKNTKSLCTIFWWISHTLKIKCMVSASLIMDFSQHSNFKFQHAIFTLCKILKLQNLLIFLMVWCKMSQISHRGLLCSAELSSARLNWTCLIQFR